MALTPVLILAVAGALAAPATGPVSPAAATAALARTFDGIDAPGGPGCVSAVAQNGRIVAQRADGMADLEHDLPLAPDMAFDIGSTSKQFTATSIALLARRGKVDLDADIRTYLPAMKRLSTPVTVRQLVHHSGGIADPYGPLERLYGDADANLYPSDFTLRMAERADRTEFTPGSRYEYSNVGYLLLGQIVEKVSGQTLRAFADENIFGPLGMTRTHFIDDYREIVPKRAHAYTLRTDGKTWERRHSDFTVMGDGGVYSTLADLAKWYDNFAHPRLEGGRELVDLLTTPGRYAEAGPSYRGKAIDYGFGTQMMEWKGRRVIGHPGGWAGYSTVPYHFPERNLTVIAICNTRPKTDVIGAVLDLGAELATAP